MEFTGRGLQKEAFPMIAVIAGATGLVGSQLLQQLCEDKSISKIISVGRRKVGIQNPKLVEILIDELSEIKKHAFELKGDLYFCCLGTTIKAAGSQANFKKIDLTAICDFAQIAQANNAKCFSLVSASGANAKSKIFYSRIKGEAEDFVQSLNFNRLVIVRPSLLIGKRKESRRFEAAAIFTMKKIGPLLPTDWRKRIMTADRDVATKMLKQSRLSLAGTFVIEANEI